MSYRGSWVSPEDEPAGALGCVPTLQYQELALDGQEQSRSVPTSLSPGLSALAAADRYPTEAERPSVED